MHALILIVGLIASSAYAGLSRGSGNCGSEPPSGLIDGYKSCLGSKYASHMQNKTGLAIDTKEKVGYLIEDGKPTTCFSITIGSAGLGTGENQTETGLFTTEQHPGIKYQTTNADYEKKGISMGIGGKILHSDHGNNATAGCIGIQMDKWKEVFDKLAPNSKVDPGPVYVSGGSCDHSSNRSRTQDVPASAPKSGQ